MTPTFPDARSREELETGQVLAPRFNAEGLISAIAKDRDSGDILMIAWMNADALRLTIETGEAHYWSRSRAELWHKGMTSGHIQKVHEIRVDCDQDAVLLIVDQHGPGACHVGYKSCFFRRVTGVGADGTIALEPVTDRSFDPDDVY